MIHLNKKTHNQNKNFNTNVYLCFHKGKRRKFSKDEMNIKNIIKDDKGLVVLQSLIKGLELQYLMVT